MVEQGRVYSRRSKVCADAKNYASSIWQLCRNHQINKQTLLFNIIIFNIMSSNECEIFYVFRCAVITCRFIYRTSFKNIERQTSVKKRIAVNIYQKAVNDADNECFNDFLNHCVDAAREKKFVRVVNDSVKSAKIRKTLLKHSNLQSYTIVFDQKNIKMSDQKRFSHSFIERV